MISNMNVLFIYTSEINPERGGVQRVTKVLSDFFVKSQFNVYFLSQFTDSSENHNPQQYFFPNGSEINSQENFQFIKNFVTQHKISFIVNQSGLGGGMSEICLQAKSVSNVKVISVIHNSLLASVDNVKNVNKKLFDSIDLNKFSFILSNSYVRKIIRFLYIKKYRNNYRALYNVSDRVVLLSESYFEEFRTFIKDASKEKVISIFNPCTLEPELDLFEKRKELLYVGRINVNQKRVDLLLEIWNKIYDEHKDWQLNIVGNGKDLETLKSIVKQKNIKRVNFTGFKNPRPFFKTAKILCLTSSYEGLPLVLIEALNFSLIPILFNSFPSAKDIIKDRKTGILIKPFDMEEYALQLSNMMDNYDKESQRYLKEIESSIDRFSLENIGALWLQLFNELKED